MSLENILSEDLLDLGDLTVRVTEEGDDSIDSMSDKSEEVKTEDVLKPLNVDYRPTLKLENRKVSFMESLSSSFDTDVNDVNESPPAKGNSKEMSQMFSISENDEVLSPSLSVETSKSAPMARQHVLTPQTRAKLSSFYQLQSDDYSKIGEIHKTTGKIKSFSQNRRFSETRMSGVLVTTKAQVEFDRGKAVAVNDYCFLKTIGKGAFAEVKLSVKVKSDLVDARKKRTCYAVKIIKKNLLKSEKRRFSGRRSSASDARDSLGSLESMDSPGLQEGAYPIPDEVMKEIAIMKLLVHPNLVQLAEIIDDDSSRMLYLVMEFCELGPVMQYNPSTSRFTSKLTGGVLLEGSASHIFNQLLSGLAYLHLNHIAHRDIKPDNMLIGIDGVLKISDFGVSSHFAEEKSKLSVGLRQLARSKSRGAVNKTEGTYIFWSPEMCQESASKYSAYMSDIWAASVCLWIFIFGRVPWFNPDVLQLFHLIRDTDPEMPHQVSRELDDMFIYMFQKDEKNRLTISDLQHHPWVTRERIEKVMARRKRLSIITRSVSNVYAIESDERNADEERADDDISRISPRVKRILIRKGKSAKERCHKRISDLKQQFDSDVQVALQKNTFLQNMSRALDMEEEEEDLSKDMFDVPDAKSVSSDDSDPLARMVSFDVVNVSLCDDDDASPNASPRELNTRSMSSNSGDDLGGAKPKAKPLRKGRINTVEQAKAAKPSSPKPSSPKPSSPKSPSAKAFVEAEEDSNREKAPEPQSCCILL